VALAKISAGAGMSVRASQRKRPSAGYANPGDGHCGRTANPCG